MQDEITILSEVLLMALASWVQYICALTLSLSSALSLQRQVLFSDAFSCHSFCHPGTNVSCRLIVSSLYEKLREGQTSPEGNLEGFPIHPRDAHEFKDLLLLLQYLFRNLPFLLAPN